MNLDLLSFALSQINYLVTNLTKKNFKSTVQEISNLVAHHGFEAERHLFCCLFNLVDFNCDAKTSSKDFCQTQYLIQECEQLIKKPNFISTLCHAVSYALEQQKNLKLSHQLLTQLSAVLKLNPIQETAFGVAFLHARSTELQNSANQFLSKKIPDVIVLATGIESTSEIQDLFTDIPAEVCQVIVKYILNNQEQLKLDSAQIKEFFTVINKDSCEDSTVLKALLQSEDCESFTDFSSSASSEMAKTVGSSMAEMICEIGYTFCSSVEECRNHLMNFGANEISPSVVAQILGVMLRTHSGLSESLSIQSMSGGSNIWNDGKEKSESNQLTTWNVAVFVQAIEEVVPSFNWKDVILELDHPGFIIKDRQSLKLLMHSLSLGLKNEEFPIKHVLKRWRNVEGQLSFYQYSLKNSDLFCFADHPCHAVSLEMLKAPPDDDSRDIATWKSLDLVETLLYLSDAGQYIPVRDLFTFPLQQCPDVLVLNLLQINSQINRLRQELLTSLIPIYLANHPNSAIILQYAWHIQTNPSAVRAIIMRAMPEWYMRGENDQTRLSRILDVAQDLKALSLLLNSSPLPFVIDLACLASRREYLKLDKWLSDKMREHGEQFIQACVTFMKRRCPQIVGGMKDESLPKSAQLPAETISTILHCLQTRPPGVSQELSEAIITMVGNCSILFNRPKLPPPGVVKTSRGLEAFSSSINPSLPTSSSASLEPLVSGIGTGMAGLNIGSSTGSRISSAPNVSSANSTGSIGGVFPLSGPLNAFANNPSSPAKMMFTGMSNSNSSGASQSAFSSLLPPAIPIPTSQVPTQTATSSSIADMSTIFPNCGPISKEVEEEANKYFACIYNIPQPTMSVDELLDLLKRFKDSPIQLEREVFTCMLRYLFEEYRFFPKYPEKDLQINAQLFGGIIEHSLVTYMALGLALRYMLEALRKPHGTNMYYFGITALDRCKNRLKEYPQYCQYLASIQHFSEFPTHLIECIEYGARSQEPPSRSHGVAASTPSSTTANEVSTVVPKPSSSVVATPAPTTKAVATPLSTTTTSGKPASAIGAKPSIANATNIDTLLVATEKDDQIEVPPEAVQDKIAFIVNNLSLANLTQKCEEIKEVLTEVYWPWLAQYIVMKRASIEPNFHNLYSNFLDTLNLPKLLDMVIKETYRNIKVLLRSDKGIANFSDRSLLKNLGHWLGILTLTKNKPILQLDLDIKSLLIEAYHNGQQELLYVVPFIAKVLDSCAKSKVFKAPNPWTIGIMNVLAELHTEPDLKLNLKFEIEVLCKTLGLDLNKLNPGNTLKDPEKLAHIELQLSQSSKHKELAMIQRIAVSSNPNAMSAAGHLDDGSHHLTSNVQFGMTQSNNTGFSTPTSMFFGGSTQNNSSMPVPTTESDAVTPTASPQPQFSYNDLNASSINGLSDHVHVSLQITLFQQHPQLKQFVVPAIERAVQDWIVQVVERSIKIALTTCEQIVKKDFALDPEESRMRSAAHHMISSLTAGMAMITCKDHLSLSISSNLKTAFNSALKGASMQQKEIIEQAVNLITQENIELACCFIQKTAVEKAIPEIDKRLATEFELRKHARNEGRRYCDPVVLTYQAERMPEQIRLKVGGVFEQQMAVYEDFACNIPGFLSTSEPMPMAPMSSSAVSSVVPAASHTTTTSALLAKPIPVMPTGASFPSSVDELSQIYDKVVAELENYIRGTMAPITNPQVAALHSLYEAVHVARNSREIVTAIVLLQKAVEGLLEGMTPQLANDHDLAIRFRDGHLLVPKALQDPRAYGPQWTNKHVTRFVIESREELHYNLDAIDALIRNHMINLQQYDLHLAQIMDNGMNYLAVAFAMQLCKLYLIDDRHSSSVTDSDLYNTVETLYRIATHSRQPPEGLNQLMDIIRANNDPGFLDRAPGGPTSLMHSGISQAREYDDPPGLHDKTEYLLREWVTMYHAPTAGRDSTKAFSVFVHQMNLQGILKTDDLITRFFRLSTEMCVDLCYRALTDPTSNATLVRIKCFHTLDAFVRLIALLVKHSGDATNTNTKINLLNKVLGIVTGVLIQDHEVRNTEFQQLPYHRIFIILFLELNTPEPILETINFQVLTAFCNTLHILRPARAPGFAYAWLEIVSHRVLIGRMLHLTPQQKAWGMFAQLMMDLFKFLAPFLRNAELPKSVALLYKGTLRVLLVLLHDFPEFLCDYHYGFCDVIPPNCIQMRNLILSAFPRNMRLPDPFTPNLKVDMLTEIAHAPRVLTNFASMIQPPSFKKDLDSYIKTRAPVTFLSELRSNLQVMNEAGQRYNIPLINALVLYVGTQAISYIHSKGLTPSMSTITHSSHMDIFQNLAVDLDTEGRYLFLNAIANQLRYPNSHTHYFSCTLLYLFAEANTEAIQEQITRVLLERLIVNRPHPWGLLITFIELIKNPSFHFWNHEFVHCAPEIEKLFDSVARSCMQQKQVQVAREQDSYSFSGSV